VKRLLAPALVATLFCSGFLNTAAAEELAALPSDREFVRAAAKADATALARLLDQEFTWTDAGGRTFSRAETLSVMPKPALGDETGASFAKQLHAQVQVFIFSRTKLTSCASGSSALRNGVCSSIRKSLGGANPRLPQTPAQDSARIPAKWSRTSREMRPSSLFSLRCKKWKRQ